MNHKNRSIEQEAREILAREKGKNETTIQRWIKRIPDAKRIELDAKCSEAARTQKPAEFTLDETIEIIRAGGNETLANLLLDNAKSKNETALMASMSDKDYNLVSMLVQSQAKMMEAQAETNNLIVKVLSKIDSVFQMKTISEKDNLVRLPVSIPEMDIRSEINKTISDYAVKENMPFNVVWDLVYTDFNYIYHTNVKVKAKNKGVSVISYIEAEGKLSELLAVAIKTLPLGRSTLRHSAIKRTADGI